MTNLMILRGLLSEADAVMGEIQSLIRPHRMEIEFMPMLKRKFRERMAATPPGMQPIVDVLKWRNDLVDQANRMTLQAYRIISAQLTRPSTTIRVAQMITSGVDLLGDSIDDLIQEIRNEVTQLREVRDLAGPKLMDDLRSLLQDN